ncbi:hypothetical protein L6E12_19100 [Actinokineospora sp. PR83]|nr:hypothetical protein [Actinokineospora sp. PR83]
MKKMKEPRTLAEAHALLSPLCPDPSRPLAERLAFYRRSAQVYERIAEIDRAHHHEALYWVSRERAKAEEIEGRIRQQREVSGRVDSAG